MAKCTRCGGHGEVRIVKEVKRPGLKATVSLGKWIFCPECGGSGEKKDK